MSTSGSGQTTQILKLCIKVLLVLLCAPATLTYALPNDREQPIHITADKVLRDEKTGVTVYSGNVEMRQGSMEVEADTLTIYHPSDDAERIVAIGKPAKMRQQPEPDKGVVHAQANTIQYFRTEDRVHLQTQARIEQDGAVVNGDSIDYFISKEVIQAEADENSSDDKVIVVLPASVQQDKPAKSPTLQVEEPAPLQPEPDPKEPSANSAANTEPASGITAAPSPTDQQEQDNSGATEGK
jgi:lipopolysaccharide export system protein LptA